MSVVGMPKPKFTFNGNETAVMLEVFEEARQAVKDLRETCGGRGKIVETPYSVVWRDFYGCSYYRVNYEENVLPCPSLEIYWDSSEQGSTVGFQFLGEAKEYIAGCADWVLEHRLVDIPDLKGESYE